MTRKLKIDDAFMKIALQEAEKAQKRGDWPIGCVIVIDNKVVAKTGNRVYSQKK